MAKTWRRVGIVLLVLVAGLGVGTWAALSQPQFGSELSGERLARARANPHYRDGAFVNPLPPAAYTTEYIWSMVKGQFFGDEVRIPPAPIPVKRIDAAELKAAPPA